VALSWFFYEMSQNPAARKKVVEEIDAVRHAPACSFAIPLSCRLMCADAQAMGSQSVATFEVASELPYTEAALLETLRLHPSVPTEGRIVCVVVRGEGRDE
jgi:cytochrome P450